MLKLILKHWKNNNMQFLMRNVINTMQMSIEKIRCFLWKNFFAKLRWLLHQNLLKNFFFVDCFCFFVRRYVDSQKNSNFFCFAFWFWFVSFFFWFLLLSIRLRLFRLLISRRLFLRQFRKQICLFSRLFLRLFRHNKIA